MKFRWRKMCWGTFTAEGIGGYGIVDTTASWLLASPDVPWAELGPSCWKMGSGRCADLVRSWGGIYFRSKSNTLGPSVCNYHRNVN